MDLSTTYMGLTLDHPIVPSASVLSEGLDPIRRLEDAGAAAVVMFSLFEEGRAHDSLSRSNELCLRLHWVAILYGRVSADLAVTGGVHSHEDALKAVMAGATVVMVASELLQNGVHRIKEILNDMTHWLEAHGYESVEQIRGRMSHRNVAEPDVLERANYRKVLQSLKPS